jgi:hypothetical protein
MRDKRSIVVVATLLLGFVSGAVRQFFAPEQLISPLDIAFMLVGVFLVFLWYRFDTDAMHYRRSPLLNVAVVALAVVALPYYFFRSRGFARGLLASAMFLLVFAAYSLLQMAGEMAVSAGYG